MLTVEGCQLRTNRLREIMLQCGLEVCVITNPRNVYYFSGFLPTWVAHAALVVDASPWQAG